MSEFMDNEKRLHAEIEELKEDRDQKIAELVSEMEKEKEVWKSRINEIDEKYRE